MTEWNDFRNDARAAGDIASAYVLVADHDVQRAALSVFESARAFGTPALVARDVSEALDTIRRHGPPHLLIVELTLPGSSGFDVVDASRRAATGKLKVIAWSASRDLREFARHRLGPDDVKVLHGATKPAVLRRAIRWARGGDDVDAGHEHAVAADLHVRMERLAERASQICGASGIAIYMKPDGADSTPGPMRALVRWNSDDPMPASPDLLPRIAEMILESGDVIHWPDLEDERDIEIEAHSIRGIVGVPIASTAARPRGAAVLFDTRPLQLREHDLDELVRLAAESASETVDARPATPLAPERAPRTAPRQPLRFPAPERPPLPDRTAAGFAIAKEVARARREQVPLSVILFHVAASNGDGDTAAADILSRVTDTFAAVSRGSDLAVRWDDEQLLVIVSGIGAAHARHVAERLRAAMHAGSGHRVPVSGGVAELEADDTVEAAVERAREQLRVAEASGHNRIA